MTYATNDYIASIDALTAKRIAEIRALPDKITVSGTKYYVSAEGCDSADGLTPNSPWKTVARVNEAKLSPGDGVFFRRGDIFRGTTLVASEGVTYSAYGEGEKPRLYSGQRDLADPSLWSLYNAESNVWKLNEKILDCGTLVFNNGEARSLKHIPTFKNMQFVCRDDESRPFVIEKELTGDLDMVSLYSDRTTDSPSKGESFPIPIIDGESLGDLYLRCDRGNPGEVFDSIEALERRSMIAARGDNVTINNLCIKYVGAHGIGGGGICRKGLHVIGCELGWIGGVIQHYFGTDPNYPEGGRGTVTRFGNAVEIYGGCDDYAVTDCYIYQVYDAGITHQVTTKSTVYEMKNIKYLRNVIEKCVYSIEYFLEKLDRSNNSLISNCEMADNILRHSGYGWGQQRHNFYSPAHIKGWSYDNDARNFSIHNNIFDRAAFRMLHLVATDAESLPEMYENTYIQTNGLSLGQYGSKENGEPANRVFDERADKVIAEVLKDRDAKVYFIK